MKQLPFIISLIAFALTSCGKNNSENIEPTPDPTTQTTLMYMTGTDLSYYFNRNIDAIEEAINDDALGSGRFLIFKHSSSSSATLKEYKYEDGVCTVELLKSYTNITSLTYDAITEVIADTKEFAPADNYNLIVSGHATGWVPKERTSSTWSAPSATPSSSIDWESMFASSSIVTRYLGSDSDSYFDIEELQESLEGANTHFGYILFDQCFMSSIEALYDLKDLCDYIIASPCEIMGDGFPYTTVIPQLFTDGGSSFNLQGVCEAFYTYYSAYSLPSGCVAVTVTSELDALAEITQLINTSYSSDEVDLSQIQAYERLSNHIFFDFEEYMVAKCNNDAIADQFLAQMELAYPSECRLHTKRFFANIGVSASSANNYDAYFTTIEYYSGVTTSAPSTQMAADWSDTAWAKATN